MEEKAYLQGKNMCKRNATFVDLEQKIFLVLSRYLKKMGLPWDVLSPERWCSGCQSRFTAQSLEEKMTKFFLLRHSKA